MTEDRKDKQNLKIHLSGSKYIVGNGLCYFIVSESSRKNKKGEKVVVQKRLSGYHTNFVDLIDSYFRDTIRDAEIDGDLEDLVKLIKKTRTEIRGWFKVLDKVMKEETDD